MPLSPQILSNYTSTGEGRSAALARLPRLRHVESATTGLVEARDVLDRTFGIRLEIEALPGNTSLLSGVSLSGVSLSVSRIDAGTQVVQTGAAHTDREFTAAGRDDILIATVCAGTFANDHHRHA